MKEIINKNAFYLILFGVLLSFPSCTKEVKNETVVYQNDLETGDLSAVSDGKITAFNNTNVLGRYNKGGFKIQVNDLPPHNMIQVSFDLYIHDSWDGNNSYDEGPDLWQMTADGQTVINTTFANRECNAYWDCIMQSYPSEYPHSNLPRAGEVPVNLPGACVLAAEKGSSLYRIVKLVRHTQSTLTLHCYDKLKQGNAPESFQECDESWSVDNIEIKAIEYK